MASSTVSHEESSQEPCLALAQVNRVSGAVVHGAAVHAGSEST